ncbi:TetR family transcriptional regulator C-terminal domain-containing protein [Streptosporangium sp. G11]|uniref:TetR family transcriptional regulator C-terminal domain-containing protein n=1 Tax=Streptosporangium sp. G11 TaxID=3436926 RepID=UPI003EB8111C
MGARSRRARTKASGLRPCGSSETGRSLSGYAEPGSTPAQQYEAMWERIIESFTAHRPLWIASFEAFLQAEHYPELRRHLSRGQVEGRRGLVAILVGVEEDAVGDDTARTLGSVQMALMSGVVTQWLLDPEQAPSAAEVVAGLRAIVAGLGAEAR